nr:hypothetical protein [Bacteroides fragilis]
MKKLVFCAAFVAAMCMAGTTAQAQDVKKKEVKKEQCDKKDGKACCKKEEKACCKKKLIRKHLTDAKKKPIAKLKPDVKTPNAPKTKEERKNKRF